MGVGEHIRRKVIPQGMSVTEAARRMGVSRVALSNLLNGRASLSTAMRTRLERTFGADPDELREAQERGEGERRRNEEKAVEVRAYAPEWISIKARDISAWARDTDSRKELPVLVRRLVHSTGRGVCVADFPGYDNAERPGWDGWIEADESTPWIPAGKSGWELGTGQDVPRKAESDYQRRLRSVAVEDRSECTFVFVTPHDWPGKRLWAESKQADGWRDVRVLDASDLEQWLEESLTGQAWMASRVRIPVQGVRTLEACWQCWTSWTHSPMTPAMFEPLVSMHARTIGDWLAGTGGATLVVSAESVDEALAFLACVSFTDGGLRLRETAIVFDAADALRRLARATSKMTIVVHDPDLEGELASAGGRHRAIIVRPRNIVGTEPDVTLPMLSYEQLRSGLAAMGIEDPNRVQRLARESGGSLTVLRRRLSDVDTPPAWSRRDASLTEELVPMALVGVWDTTSCADRRVLEKLSGRPYAEVEATVSRALKADDRPMWASGNHRGVVSRIDLLFTVANAMTASRVELFFDVAADVLGEEDPALALPEDERWMASFHRKVRRHSDALRVAVGETLVLLATSSKKLRQVLPEIDLESRVAAAVRALLTPMSPDLALSQERDLPCYAEAAPKVYLAAVEEDLARREPAVTGLLQPTGRAPFLRFPRTGLLSGLECLAWSTQHLMRVVLLLAEMSKTEIDDNCANTAFNSLLSVFRFWMPQTSAPLDTRVKVLRQLCEREPEMGWQVCMEQLDASPRLVASGSYMPRWRDFATGYGKPVPDAEALEFRNRAVEIALGWQHDAETLADLVANLPGIGARERLEVWRLIEEWTAGPDATDEGRQRLGERIRGVVLTHRGARMLPTPLRKRARAVYDKLVPENSIGRIAWLFRSGGVEETADDTEAEEGGARLDRIDRLGRDAMWALWTETGFAGIDRLLAANGSPLEIGRHLAPHVGDPRMVRDVVAYVLGRSGSEQRVDRLLTGFFGGLNDAVLEASLGQLVRELRTAVLARVFLRAPVRSGTWRIIDGLPAEVRDQYWRQVAAPVILRLTSAEWEELVDKLLAVGRPVAAMHAADMHWDQVGTSCLRRILEAVGTHPSNDPGEQVDLRVMSDGMTSLSERVDVTEDELAGLELRHVTTLEHSEYGIPNLEKRISESPEMFVQLLGMAYRRDDGQNDGAEGDDSKQQGAALVACAILRRMKRVPGEEGQSVDAEKLQRWVVKVRNLAASCGRAEVGDVVIGELLAGAAGDLDQSPWPPRAICQVMEAAASDRMGHGFVTGVRNARGVTVRAVDEGGRRERDLAAVYAAHADAQMIESPFVSTVLRWLEESFESDAKWMDAKTEVDQRLAQ